MVWLKHSGKKGCGYVWNYTGKKNFMCTCPDCYRKVKIRESEIKKPKWR
jgi:hypothetical protein